MIMAPLSHLTLILLRALLKQVLYGEGKQYSSLNSVWEVVAAAAQTGDPTDSMKAYVSKEINKFDWKRV